MSLLCRFGWHHWRAFGGETVRDQQGKVKMQWYVCQRARCDAMAARNKGFALFKG